MHAQVSDEAVPWLDTSVLEELFATRAIAKKESAEELSERSASSKAPPKLKNVELLDAKRANSVATVMGNMSFMQITMDALILALKEGDTRALENPRMDVSNFLPMVEKMMPTAEEIELCEAYEGPAEQLRDVERLFLKVISPISPISPSPQSPLLLKVRADLLQSNAELLQSSANLIQSPEVTLPAHLPPIPPRAPLVLQIREAMPDVYGQRARCLLLKTQFGERLAEVAETLELLSAVVSQLRKSEAFRHVLTTTSMTPRTISLRSRSDLPPISLRCPSDVPPILRHVLSTTLAIGNHLNGTSAAGSAWGFKLHILTELGGTKVRGSLSEPELPVRSPPDLRPISSPPRREKSICGSTTLLHHLAARTETEGEGGRSLASQLRAELSALEGASIRFEWKEVESDARRLEKDVKDVIACVERDKVAPFKAAMAGFVEEASRGIAAFHIQLEETAASLDSLGKWIAEDKLKDEPEKFLLLLQEFVQAFDRADRFNREERERAELKAKKKERAEKEAAERAERKAAGLPPSSRSAEGGGKAGSAKAGNARPRRMSQSAPAKRASQVTKIPAGLNSELKVALDAKQHSLDALRRRRAGMHLDDDSDDSDGDDAFSDEKPPQRNLVDNLEADLAKGKIKRHANRKERRE